MGKDRKLEYYQANTARLSSFAKYKLRAITEMASQSSAERLLDIGCSEGTITSILGKVLNAREIHGIELSPEAIKEATEKGIKVAALDVDVDRLPFQSEYFDFIFCGDVIEHLFSSENILKECYRILKPGGTLLLTTPNLGSWYNRLALFAGYQPFGTAASLHYSRAGKPSFTAPEGKWGIGDWGGEHIRVMTLKALKGLLKYHNYEIVRIKGAYGDLGNQRFIYKMVGVADRLLSSFPSLATWMIVKAKKHN